MGGLIRKDFQYKKVKNFLNNSEIELLRNYTIMKHRNNTNNFDEVQSKTFDTYFYGDPITDSLMLAKLKLMEQETGLILLPTYSFWRMYSYSADLKEHKDRDACEISVTVMIGGDGTPWPIYMGDTPIDMEPGDACIYLGCELNHSRKEFEGDWHSQAFLHYVDANGPKAKEKFDRRPFLI
tara:strand:+ start:920 stop:1462 length:543 start_codon:yes stop_codon:yes gene_type:complete